MPSPSSALSDLLAEMFTEAELRRFVARLDGGEALGRELPGDKASRVELAEATAALLQRRGRVDAAFFEALAARAGADRGQVEEVAGHWELATSDRVAEWRRHVRARHAHLQVLGLRTDSVRHQFLLDDLAVDVELAAERSAHDLGMGRRGFGAPRADSLGAARSLPVALAAAEAQTRRFGYRGVVLVGPPGSGKTTLLKKQLGLDASGDRIPLLLSFSTRQRLGLERLSLVDWAEEEAKEDGFAGAGRALLGDRGKRFRFLLDGYDEVQGREDREKLLAWLALEMPRWPVSDFVITTRKAAWDRDDHSVIDPLLPAFVLLDLTRAAVVDYVERFFPLLAERELGPCPEPADLARETAAAGRLGLELLRLLDDPKTAEHGRVVKLAGNPLLLSLVCLVYFDTKALPHHRGELYQKCFDVLIRGGRVGGQRTGFLPHTGRKLLGPLAWEMQETADDIDSPKEVGRQVVLDHLDAAKEELAEVTTRDAEDLRRVLVEQCGLLVCPDQENHAFAHLTFQEYLAFQYAHGRAQAGQLAERAREARWREPILLGMAEENFQRMFFDRLLAEPDRVGAVEELLVACVREQSPPLEPFVAMLKRVGPTVEDLRVVLGLFRARRSPVLAKAAEGLVGHSDETVRRLAREVAGMPPELGMGSRMWIEALGMEFVWVPAGSFLMGATTEAGRAGFDEEARPSESPPHGVTVTRGFWLGRFPVTNAQYRRYVKEKLVDSPGSFRRPGFDDPEMPVTEVSWYDAASYCSWASDAAGREVTLPTEAEWEYTARGSDSQKYPWREGPPTLERAWYQDGVHNNKINGPARVGGRPSGAGPFGAEEQAGNVWEWCADPKRIYTTSAVVDPGLSEIGKKHQENDRSRQQEDVVYRVFRGGSWGDPAERLRTAVRSSASARLRDFDLGFRVVCRVPEP